MQTEIMLVTEHWHQSHFYRGLLETAGFRVAFPRTRQELDVHIRRGHPVVVVGDRPGRLRLRTDIGAVFFLHPSWPMQRTLAAVESLRSSSPSQGKGLAVPRESLPRPRLTG